MPRHTSFRMIAHVALLVRHPGAPGVVYKMTDPMTSIPETVSAIEGAFHMPAGARRRLAGDGRPLPGVSVWMPVLVAIDLLSSQSPLHRSRNISRPKVTAL